MAEINPDCTKCNLYKTSKTTYNSKLYKAVCVGGVGDNTSPIMFVGEALGINETVEKIPFVGSAGRMLTQAIEAAGYERSDVYLDNAIKCKPPENRKPTPTEIKACRYYLEKEIKRIKPKVICVLGATPLMSVLKMTGITKVRGRVLECKEFNCEVFATLHPAFILRNIDMKNIFFKDIEEALNLAFGKTNKKEKQPKKYYIIKDIQKLEVLKNKLLNSEIISLDSETTGINWLDDNILCVSCSWKEHTGALIPLYKKDIVPFWNTKDFKIVKKILKEILESPVKKIFQNGKFDYKFFVKLGFDIQKMLKSFYFDTLLAHHLIDETTDHDLGFLAWKYTEDGGYDDLLDQHKTEVIKRLDITKDELNYGMLDDNMLWTYGCYDADVTLQCYNKLIKELEEQDLLELFHTIVMPLNRVLTVMEMNGIKIDKTYLESAIKEFTIRREKIYKDFVKHKSVIKTQEALLQKIKQEITDKFNSLKKPRNTLREYITESLQKDAYRKKIVFNVNSTDHLKLLFFEVEKLKPPFYTKKLNRKTGEKNPKTNFDALEILAKQSDLANQVLLFRNVEKFLSTFLIGMKKKIGTDGRLRTDYMQHRAENGRLSSKSPNLQNIPKRVKSEDVAEENKGVYVTPEEVRRIFIAEKGHSLCAADLMQIEFRMWIEHAQDANAIQDLVNKVDIHKKVAAKAYKVPFDEVTKKQRFKTKHINFGLIYGRGVKSIMQQIKSTEEETKEVIRYFFANYSDAKQWLEDTKQFAIDNGYVVSIFGRRRRLSHLKILQNKSLDMIDDEEFRTKLSKGLRQAMNAPPAGSAADVMAICLIRLQRRIYKEKLPVKLLLQIHDDVTAEVRDDYIDYWAKVLREEMTRPIGHMKVPLDIEIEVGKDLGGMKEYKLLKG